jgi:hypothetical protein
MLALFYAVYLNWRMKRTCGEEGDRVTTQAAVDAMGAQ